MATLLINDVLDELREEVNRLLNQNQKTSDLLNKFRDFSMNLQNICVCNQKPNNEIIIKSLEDEYQHLKSENPIIHIKSEDLGEDLEQTMNLFGSELLEKRLRTNCLMNGQNEGNASNESIDFQWAPNDSEDDDNNCGKPENKKKYKCNHCNKCFDRMDRLKDHEFSHSGQKNFECEVCHKLFVGRRTLLGHIKVHSSDRKVFHCEFCDYKSHYNKNMRNHVKYQHFNVSDQLICEVQDCHKVFKTRHTFLNHMRTVHGDRQFACEWPDCGQTYYSQKNYEAHQRSHLDIRPFLCDFEGCNMSFVRKKNLSAHRDVHLQRFVCSWPQCDKRFGSKQNLSGHLNKHQNNRAFKCTFDGCDKGFFKKTHLSKHYLIHIRSGEDK